MVRPTTQPEERNLQWHWRDAELDDFSQYPAEEPAEPKVGTIWLNPDLNCLYVWDGIEWVAMPLD
jgi:hypothetical protein